MKLFKTRLIFIRNQSRCKERKKEKTIGKGRKKWHFLWAQREKRKRRERVRAKRADVGEKTRRGEILDTPKPVASPSVNSTCWRELFIKAELSTLFKGDESVRESPPRIPRDMSISVLNSRVRGPSLFQAPPSPSPSRVAHSRAKQPSVSHIPRFLRPPSFAFIPLAFACQFSLSFCIPSFPL